MAGVEKLGEHLEKLVVFDREFLLGFDAAVGLVIDSRARGGAYIEM